MNPQKRNVEHFLKLAAGMPASLPLGVLSVVVGAFIVGAIVNAASLTPPTAAYPEGQPQLDVGGGGASNLLDALKGGPLAEWKDFKYDTVIGGRLGLGQVRKTIGAGVQRIGYPLDMQIVHDIDEGPTAAELAVNAYLNKNNTAVLRIASGSKTADEKLYTGIRFDRLTMAPSAQEEDTLNEKWFIGMDNTNDNLIIRANGNTNLVSIDPAKGAACFGAVFKDISRGSGDAEAKFDGSVGGYKSANQKCKDGSHVCTVEEILRTINCQPNLPIFADSPRVSAWISKG